MTKATLNNTDKPLGYNYRWLILAVMLAAEIMDLIDATIINVGGPTLQKFLGTSEIELQWIIGGYTLALGSGLILGGRLGDRYGRRYMFLFGMIGFTAASLACSVAQSTEMLITLRFAQGFLGAMLLPQGFGLLKAVFPPKELGQAFGVFGPVFGLAGILGPVIGGGLIQADLFGLGWRAVFLVNVPIGIAAAVIAWRVLPRVPGDKSIKIDILGSLLVIASSALLIYPLIQGQKENWPAWTFISLAVSIAGFVLFAFQQRWISKTKMAPLINPTILTKPAYTVGLLGMALFFAAVTGFGLIITLFLQLGHGFSSGEAGLGNIPIAVGFAIGAGLSGGFLAAKFGRKVLQLGAALELVGLALLWLVVQNQTDFNFWTLVPGMVITGLGSGLIVAALFDIVLGAADETEVGSASGVLSAVQSIASSFGVAIFGTVFFAQAKVGAFNQGLLNALWVSALLMVLFLIVTPFLPKESTEQAH
jgi:EmrB/QacA subfamily drug resistance transporter